MSDIFLQGFSYFFNFATSDNTTIVRPCEEGIDHYKFYQFSLIPAVLLCLLFAATKTRRRILSSILSGRPGLVYPMDTLTRSTSLSYGAAFGATAFLVYKILIDQKFAVEYNGPIALQSLIAIVSMFIYGIVFFPVFASLALATAFSYGLGSLYVWMFFIVDFYKLTECEYTRQGRLVLVIRAIPSMACLAYLSVTLPIRFVLAIRQKRYFESPWEDKPKLETLQEIKESYQGLHVRDLLQKPLIKPPPVALKDKILAWVKEKLHQWIYHRKRGFKYPSRLVSVMLVAGCVVYVVTVEFLVFFATLFNNVLDSFGETLDSIGWSAQPGDTKATTLERSAVLFGYYVTYVVKVSTIVSITLSSALSCLTILHMMSSYRTNLFAMYRGDFTNIPAPSTSSAMALCVGSMKYAGYQVAYIFWAYVVCSIVLFVVCLILATIISLLANGISDWLVDNILQAWPGFLIAILLYILQMLMAKFFFLQQSGQHLRLDNRRSYFIFTYFMFFFNIFMGMFSCLVRILKAMGIGIIFLARLDNSTLPRKFEFFDPGFTAYQGFIHMEAAHTHPVVNVFIRLLIALSKSRKIRKHRVIEMTGSIVNTSPNDMSNGKDGVKYQVTDTLDEDDFEELEPAEATRLKKRLAARFNWHVTYTLLQNPMVRIYRKGYIQALKRARAEGIKIPISDKMFTDFDLVKSKEELEKEKEEELRKIKELKEMKSSYAAIAKKRDSFDQVHSDSIADGYEMVNRRPRVEEDANSFSSRQDSNSSSNVATLV